MKLYTPNNHIVAEIDGKFYVLDTGLPFSFSYTGDKCILRRIADNDAFQGGHLAGQNGHPETSC